MESEETLGDSFLKLATSIYVYTMNKDYDCESLDQARHNFLRNDKLFELACTRNFIHFMCTDKHSDYSNWLLPRYDLSVLNWNVIIRVNLQISYFGLFDRLLSDRYTLPEGLEECIAAFDSRDDLRCLFPSLVTVVSTLESSDLKVSDFLLHQFL